MGILTAEDVEKLLANGRAQKAATESGDDEIDHQPVVRLFSPWTDAYWLISEINPDNPDEAFAFVDLDVRGGNPEMGDVYISELDKLYNSHPVHPIERDTNWIPRRTLTEYWEVRGNGLRGKEY